MDRDKNINALRDKIREKGKERERSPHRDAPEAIRIGSIGDGATVIIGGDHSVRLSPIHISIAVFTGRAERSADLPVPMGMADASASATVRAFLDALAPPGAPTILLPARRCASSFKRRALGSNHVARPPAGIKAPANDDAPAAIRKTAALCGRPGSSGEIRVDPAQIKACGRQQPGLPSGPASP
jgi:hypothetical protein